MKNCTITFWKFLSDNGIEVPIIQRDYAQGRDGKEELRKSFLRDLNSALNEKEQMKLDFVYGTMESGKLIPLDGQQRLTTLWLLHWYIAFRAGELNTEVVDRLRKFTYETRISSRQFCEGLAGFSVLPPANTDIAKHIRNQRWFRHAWRNDPTIQSMLRMISGTLEDKSDGVDGVFNCSQERCKDYWKILTSPDCPITFYHLNLPGIAHSDDLYIKMNSRGKPLTSFENFKADLAGYIDKSKTISLEWESLYDLRDGLSIRMDTSWMRLFWANKSSANTIDEAYFAFINRFFFNEVCLDKTDDGNWLVPSGKENANSSYKYLNDSRNGSDYDRRIAYTSLEYYRFHNGVIPLGVLQHLKKTMDAFCDFMDSCKDDKIRPNELIPQCEWDKDFKFFPEYSDDNGILKDNAGNEIRKVTVLTQPQRVVFFAVCKFFWELKCPDKVDYKDTKRKLEQWLRVVWNLASVQDTEGKTVIRTFDTMRTAMEFIEELDSQNVYECLANMKSNEVMTSNEEKETAFNLQCKEEIQKALKIRGDISENMQWENKISCAENFAFFRGAIRFLYRDENGNVKWSDFDSKFKNAQAFFDINGVSNDYRKKALLLRSFLARVGERNISDDFWFSNYRVFWRERVLLGKDFMPIVCELLLSGVSKDNAMPVNGQIPFWVLDETLLSDAMGDDNSKWHILTSWKRDGDKTLTQYSRREQGNVNHPEQIIPLDFTRNEHRNELLKNMKSEQKRGSRYFIGWNSDINFKYKGYNFQWYGTPDYDTRGELDIYLMKRDDECAYQEKPDYDAKKLNDAENYYCFDAREIRSQTDFKIHLDELIKQFEDDYDGT